MVVEVAAWACGERDDVDDEVFGRLVELATAASADPLVRESSVAALGAIGDERGLDAILAATADKPAIRRRAVLALAPFLDPGHPRAGEIDAALHRALEDRDWQVRQAAEDLLPATESLERKALLPGTVGSGEPRPSNTGGATDGREDFVRWMSGLCRSSTAASSSSGKACFPLETSKL